MRSTFAAIVATAISMGISLSPAQAEAVKASPNLTVFTKDQPSFGDRSPTILRGSATRRGTVYRGDIDYADRAPIDLGTGPTLWLVDPDTGDIIACEPRRSSRIGSRRVQCVDGPAPY